MYINSVKSDEEFLNQIRDDMTDHVKCKVPNDVMFTPNSIVIAVGNLSSQKYDGYMSAFYDHFIYASHTYIVVLSMLINGMLVHSYNVDDLLKSILVSIP